MPDLKLAKLPDRTPVKITIAVSPDLNQRLQSYADLYRESYGATESVQELIPYILENFLESDRGFAKARKGKEPDGRSVAPAPGHVARQRRSETPEPPSTAN